MMAEASRFPHLAPPFAIVGAAAGWLCAATAANPLVQSAETNTFLAAPLIVMGIGALTGAILTRFCVGKRYWYELVDPDPSALARSDRWWRHIAAVILAGAASGAAIAAVCDAYNNPAIGAAGGALFALAFIPVCAAVILAARRAQRARLGSIVAGSDRRAVWGILATALAVATVEVALNWPAAAAGDVPSPWPALGMLAMAAIVILWILFADVRALRRARQASVPGLVERDPAETAEDDTAALRVDFGLGDGLAARLARSASAYRGRDRTLALVRGDPEQAFGALRRAIRRGVLGLAVMAGVAGVHAAGDSAFASELFDRHRCENYDSQACGRMATRYRDNDLELSVAYHIRACEGAEGQSCAALAEIYENGQGGEASEAMALRYYERACDVGLSSYCRRAKEYKRRVPLWQQRSSRVTKPSSEPAL
jgi:hypothetical protein